MRCHGLKGVANEWPPVYENRMITVILATKNNEVDLAIALSALVTAAVEGIVREVVVVDGGSQDGTATVADAAGCTLVTGAGPDALMSAADNARTEWLLFLSPLSVLDPAWHGEVLSYLDQAILSGKAETSAATFRLRRGDAGFGARLAEISSVFRSRMIAAPYAEQGLLISKAFYRSLGGHKALPAMTDMELAGRIGRRRLKLLRSHALVSARTPASAVPALG